MRLLLDTQLLLWAAYVPAWISPAGRALIEDSGNELLFSPASLWEVVIKRALGRADFRAEPRVLRRGLVENGYAELPIASEHALAVEMLPAIHKDPFDRLLVAQSLVEGLTFVTADTQLASYPGSIAIV